MHLHRMADPSSYFRNQYVFFIFRKKIQVWKKKQWFKTIYWFTSRAFMYFASDILIVMHTQSRQTFLFLFLSVFKIKENNAPLRHPEWNSQLFVLYTLSNPNQISRCYLTSPHCSVNIATPADRFMELWSQTTQWKSGFFAHEKVRRFCGQECVDTRSIHSAFLFPCSV